MKVQGKDVPRECEHVESGVCFRCRTMPVPVEVTHERGKPFSKFLANVSNVRLKRTTGEDVMALVGALQAW
jgi:hypothetical protein